MLNLWTKNPRPGVLDRREMLRLRGLGMLCLSLPALLNATAASAATKKSQSFGRAKNCILLYLSGGPAQLDTFDPKPDAPDDIGGEFSTIPTTLPVVRFSELLPNTAKWMTRPPICGRCGTNTTTTAAARTGCSPATRTSARSAT